MTSKLRCSDGPYKAQNEAAYAAEALRQKHERIGRLVEENATVLSRLSIGLRRGHYEGAFDQQIGNSALESILKEVDS